MIDYVPHLQRRIHETKQTEKALEQTETDGTKKMQ